MHLNFEDKPFNLFCGDSYELLKQLPDNSIDSIVTDPPYGLSKQPDLNKVLDHWLKDEIYKSPSKGFMGKEWDSFVPSPILWKEAFRVLKPGGHILAFAGTRTQHLMAMSLGLAGFEIRDVIFWAYGSGFPKSQNISKAIDKMQGNKRNDIGLKKGIGKKSLNSYENNHKSEYNETKSTSEDGIKWEGWGTALKPAVEPITLARKPITEKTIAKNVLKHGTGGLNIDGCRINYKNDQDLKNMERGKIKAIKETNNISGNFGHKEFDTKPNEIGRFPSNLIIEENELNLSILEEKSKFFYSPKCSKIDRNEGLDAFEEKESSKWQGGQISGVKEIRDKKQKSFSKNNHPTVKPTELMAYLIKLITPKGGVILDPFNGSGSTGKAAMRCNSDFKYVGIDLDSNYIDISKARIEHELNKIKKEK